LAVTGSCDRPRHGHLLGHARVSTTDQQPHLQVDAHTAAGCSRVFTETASSARSDRPTLEQVLDQLRPGDTLVVWKLDRLVGRCATWSTPSPGWPSAGSGSVACRRRSTPPPPGGKLVFHVFAALAEFECDLVASALARGWRPPARGRHGGRPSVLTGHKLRVAREMHASGQYTVAAIAKTLGVSRASVYRHLAGAGG
jgi:DNA invertase Pin-like site-specific DNA recombinase